MLVKNGAKAEAMINLRKFSSTDLFDRYWKQRTIKFEKQSLDNRRSSTWVVLM